MNQTAKLGSQRFPCPNCKNMKAIVTFTHYGRRSFLCPDCDYVWVDPPDELPKRD